MSRIGIGVGTNIIWIPSGGFPKVEKSVFLEYEEISTKKELLGIVRGSWAWIWRFIRRFFKFFGILNN